MKEIEPVADQIFFEVCLGGGGGGLCLNFENFEKEGGG